MYDVIIIGMGVAGITSAIYAKRAGLKVLMLEGSAPGGILNIIPKIENYPGIKEISGPDLAMNLYETVKDLQIDYKLDKVTDVILDSIKTVKTTNDVYQARKLIIATGRKPKMLGLKNEEKYLGKGISTCALCDGAFYKNKDVAVIGGGSSAVSEALYLSNICRKVYLIHRKNEFKAETILIEELKKHQNIIVLTNQEVKEYILNNDQISGLVLKDNQVLDISGIFLYIGFIPNTNFLLQSGVILQDGYIVVDQNYMTNIEGVYACGDVIKKDIYQIVTATAEGASCAINISKS